MLNMNTRLVGLKDSHIIWYNNTLDRGLINDSKGNVKIVFEWRCGADWPGQRRGVKHLHPCKIKVQITAVACSPILHLVTPSFDPNKYTV